MNMQWELPLFTSLRNGDFDGDWIQNGSVIKHCIYMCPSWPIKTKRYKAMELFFGEAKSNNVLSIFL
jgi:hypothetical protein